MRIAVLGTRGFVGSYIFKHLNQSHMVTSVTRDNLDMLDPHAVNRALQAGGYDVIVNCAAVMTDANTLDDARNNLGLFMNFYNNSELFGKFINLASGAEYDRTQDINSAEEELIFERVPKDSYGWGQNIKSRLCAEKYNFYNIRIFNCFGPGEPETRIFPRYLNKSATFEINNDREFDYFSIQDLCTVVRHCAEHDWLVKDVNAVYTEKYKISEVLNMFCTANGLEPDFIVASTSSNNYTGSGEKLQSLGIKLNGLYDGLSTYIKKEENDSI